MKIDEISLRFHDFLRREHMFAHKAYLAARTVKTTDKLHTIVPASVSELYMDCAQIEKKYRQRKSGSM
jgi:hypothetical protein